MKHPGFAAVQKKIAGAILAARSRNASKSAKRRNPHLNRVKG